MNLKIETKSKSGLIFAFPIIAITYIFQICVFVLYIVLAIILVIIAIPVTLVVAVVYLIITATTYISDKIQGY